MERTLYSTGRGAGKTRWLVNKIRTILDASAEKCYVMTTTKEDEEKICNYLTSFNIPYSTIKNRVIFIYNKIPKETATQGIIPKKVPTGSYVFADDFLLNLGLISQLSDDIHFFGTIAEDWFDKDKEDNE